LLSHFLFAFLFPYVAVLSRAAWNIQQNLEGAGLLSSDMTAPDLRDWAAGMGAAAVSGWDPGASVRGILGLLCEACLLFVPFVMLAGYAIGRTRGVLETIYCARGQAENLISCTRLSSPPIAPAAAVRSPTKSARAR
jgi:hypothetical protein